jgi:AraC family transcriptional regulator
LKQANDVMNTPRVRLYGDVLRRTLVAGFTLTETAYASDLRLPEHSHQEPYFCFVLAGSFTEISGKQARYCCPRSVLFHPSGEAHSDHFHTGARCFNLQYGACGADDPSRWQARIANRPVNSLGGRLAQLAARLYREFCMPDEVSQIMIEGLALQMMAETFRQTIVSVPVAPPWLGHAKDILDEQFSARPSLASLAKSADVHPAHLAREFRRFYGGTITEYVRQRRLDFACHELLNSRVPLIDIALAAGFFDQSHFARTFKAQMGMSPNQYRTTLSAG